ncbi:N-acetylmuramoyl-L-alanine amidase [Frankia sp. AgPm24]|uniref:peptidoglycan recognition protein family protein n=1 Tax=Frankia sp. AgPm24 TaxID=631128 RepID=UPI00200E9BA5|nr:peptidoglycan recognition family protein [Frankia sp. AgPm24]MCK9922464.1 N-acetylmuramoyl-L-alanine amidase [Frankia sp. AgPm24]
MTTYPARYPGATWRPVPHHSPGLILPPRGFLPHVQMGRGSLLGWFSNARSGVSSHLWLGYDGELEQYVDLTRKAWAEAAGNPYWISCECEGTAAEDYTPAQIARLAEIYRWGMGVYGWPAEVTDDPNGRGIGTHRMGGSAWGGHDCPGDLRANRRHDILAAAVALDPPTTPIKIKEKEADMPLTDAEMTTIAQRAAAETLRALWDQMCERPTGASDSWYPPRQAHAGAVLRRGYEMSGASLTAASSLEQFFVGPFAEWSARIEAAVGELRGLLDGGALAGADPAAAASIASRLDALLEAFAAPRAYTLTPGPAAAQ